MQTRFLSCCLLCACLTLPFAQTLSAADAKISFSDVPVSPNSGYVTIPLDAYANHQSETAFPSNVITVNRIPFQLVKRGDADNLFLADAGWTDWEADPSRYYSKYDGVPRERDPRRFMFQVPVADYYCVYLLAAAEDDEAFSDVISFRIGAFDYSKQTTIHDFEATVPRRGNEKAREPRVRTEHGDLFLVQVPIRAALAQDFQNRWALDVDLTKKLRLAVRRPDPCRYRIRPLGLPSGVHIYGMTFRISDIQMRVEGNQPGNVFNEPEKPSFTVTLEKTGSRRFGTCELDATATDFYGNTISTTITDVAINEHGAPTQMTVTLPAETRGFYELELLLRKRRTPILSRATTFALLPPDTRRYRDESPFGTWDFSGGHFTPRNPDLLGPLYVKAGLRYGMFHQPPEVLEKYGVLKGNDKRVSAESVQKLKESMEEDPSIRPPERLMIFHETSISGSHIMRVPDVFTGRPPYTLSEKEQEKFDSLWEMAETTAKAIHETFPNAEIYFGNGAPQLLEEFCRHGFPAELMGSRGNEAGTFMRMPESQPTDFVANNAGLWMDRMILDHYDYTNTPLRQCYEMCYPSTNPGNLSEPTQAKYFVRHMMHSLAWRIPVIRACIITDTGNSYYFSNWGASGLCRAAPHVCPKPAYVACATMTLMLDGTFFTRALDTGSPVVYAMEFERKDGGFVTCLWTLRGSRELTLSGSFAKPVTVMDMMGNETAPTAQGGPLALTVTDAPIFVRTDKPVTGVTCGKAEMRGRPETGATLVAALDTMDAWTVDEKRNTELEVYNFDQPRRKGSFTYTVVPEFEGETSVLKVEPTLPVDGPTVLPMYSVLAHRDGIDLPGEPTGIGLMVNGNGSWGRVIFELEDASGQRWISIGAEQKGEPTRWMADWLTPEEFKSLTSMGLCDWNTNDPWKRSFINFEGWRYVEFPLPGNYPGEGYHWPYSSQWRYDGDGVVHYPLTLKKLILTQPEQIVVLTEARAPARKAIYLKDLMVTEQPPAEAFAAE